MSGPSSGDITGLLKRWSGGDRGALDELMPIVHKELRRLAQSYFRNERSDHTLQATALVNEAFLRLIQGGPIENRSHFFAVSARAMRQILIDHARQKRAAKRGGGEVALAFDEAKGTPGPDPVDVLELDILLKRLADLDPRQAEVVEIRYFTGLSLEETAEVLGTSTATVKRDWNLAKAWLRRELLRDFSMSQSAPDSRLVGQETRAPGAVGAHQRNLRPSARARRVRTGRLSRRSLWRRQRSARGAALAARRVRRELSRAAGGARERCSRAERSAR